MAKSKYNADTFPELAKGYAKQGLSDLQIAKKLGISEQTFYNYTSKYLEFFEAIKEGKVKPDEDVENAVLKRALGYEYDEVTIEYEIKNGKQIEKSRKVIKKHYMGSETAQIYWLSNRKPDVWKRKDKEEYEKKEEDKVIFIIPDNKRD